jgi:hypothetical protein
MRKLALMLALAGTAMTITPSIASADVFIGVGFGRALPHNSAAPAERVLTLDVGSVSEHGWFGAEADYSLLPKLENGGQARTLSGSVILGKKTAAGWRPYGSVGFGHLGPVETFSDNFKLFNGPPQTNVITFGGGVMGEFAKHFGARADVRVYRDVTGQNNGFPAHLTFTRIAVGAYLAF